VAKGQESTPHLPDADPSIAPAPAGHRGVIEVKNLTKRYKKADVNAVDGISFEVAEGEFFALLGPNGAGKTTTISILTTNLLPTSGKVTIGGYDVKSQSKQVREQVGIVFQQPSLDLNLTAEENVRFHAILYGLYHGAPPTEPCRRITGPGSRSCRRSSGCRRRCSSRSSGSPGA
jgi:ABC-type bacteriocin/lantibiotic exporter with double-glycine peptidase domain